MMKLSLSGHLVHFYGRRVQHESFSNNLEVFHNGNNFRTEDCSFPVSHSPQERQEKRDAGKEMSVYSCCKVSYHRNLVVSPMFRNKFVTACKCFL